MQVDYFVYDELIRLRKRAVAEFHLANEAVLRRFVDVATRRSREGPTQLELIRLDKARCALRHVDADLALVQQDFLAGWRRRAACKPTAPDAIQLSLGLMLADPPSSRPLRANTGSSANEDRYAEDLPVLAQPLAVGSTLVLDPLVPLLEKAHRGTGDWPARQDSNLRPPA